MQRPEDVSLPVAFSRFYDPNECFDGNDGSLLQWLDKRRAGRAVSLQTVSGERVLGSRGQLAVELGHLALLREDNIAEWMGLGLSETALREAVKTAEQDVKESVESVRATTLNIKNNAAVKQRIDELDNTHESTDIDILIAGAVVSALAHRNQTRLNGAPFYTHPVSVTHIESIAFRRVYHKLQRSEPRMHWLRLLQYRALNHDAFEDHLPSKHDAGTSFLDVSQNLLASPLFHQRLLESYDVRPDEAKAVAEDTYLLTKPLGRDGHIANDRYMSRFHQHYEATIVKLSDTVHNRFIDPKEKPIEDPEKEAKWRAKRTIYVKNIAKLVQHGLQAAENPQQKTLVLAVPTIRDGRLKAVRKKRLLSQLTSGLILEVHSQLSEAA